MAERSRDRRRRKGGRKHGLACAGTAFRVEGFGFDQGPDAAVPEQGKADQGGQRQAGQRQAGQGKQDKVKQDKVKLDEVKHEGSIVGSARARGVPAPRSREVDRSGRGRIERGRELEDCAGEKKQGASSTSHRATSLR